MEAPGSGGYGPPSARDLALLREDRADGYVTEKAVRRDYGIKTEEIKTEGGTIDVGSDMS